MPELYDNIHAINSQYTSRFIGSEREQLEKTANVLDERYRRNKELTDRVAIALANDRLAEGDEPIRQEAINRLKNDIDIISSSPQNFENNSSAVAKSVRDYATNPYIIKSKENARLQEEHRQRVADLQSKGQQVLDYTPQWAGTANEDGTLNTYKYEVQPKLDWDSRKEKLFNDLVANGYSKIPEHLKGEFAGFIKTGDIRYINNERIRNMLNDSLVRYKSTPEGQQEVKDLKYNNSSITDSELNLSLLESIRAAGNEKIFNQTQENLQHDPFLLDLQRKAKENIPPPYAGTSPSSPIQNTVAKPLVGSTDGTREMTGEESAKWYQQQISLSPTLAGVSPPPKVAVKGVAETDPNSYTYQFNHIANDASPELAAKISEIYKGKFNKDVFEKQHQEMLKNLDKVSPSGFHISSEQAANYDDFLNRFASSAPVVMGDDNTPKMLTEVLNEYGSDDKVQVKSSRILPTSPNKDIKGGLEFTVYKNGKPDKTGFMRINDQFDSAVSIIDDINKNSKFQGSDTYTKENPKVATEYTFKDQSGNLIAPSFYTVTLPINGKPETFVYTGLQQVDQNGALIGQPRFPNQKGTRLEAWNSSMYEKYVRPEIANILNSGQPAATKDIKDFFSDFE